MILDTADAPEDPIERLMWLSGVREQVERELDGLFEESYFWARMTGRLEEAVSLALHSRRRVLAFTRAGNEKVGRSVRWRDGN